MFRPGLLRLGGVGLTVLRGGGVTEEGAELIAACPLGLRGQATEGVELTARFKRKDSVSVLITTNLKCTLLFLPVVLRLVAA